MVVCTQMKLLMWKNFILRYGREPMVVFELGFPIVLGIVYFLLVSHGKRTKLFVHKLNPTRHHVLSHDNKTILVAYSPRTAAVEEFMRFINVSGASARGFDSVQDYLEQVSRPRGLPLITFIGINNTTSELPKHLQFTLLNQNHSHQFENVLQTFSTEADVSASTSVVTAQKLVSQTFINYWRQTQAHVQPVELNISTQVMPFSTDITKAYLLARIISCIVIVSFVPISINIIKILVSERQMYVQEFFQMLNVSNEVHWLSWCLTSILGYILVQVLLSIMVFVGQISIAVPRSSPFIIILILTVYAVNNASFCLFTTSFIMKKVTGTYVVNTVVQFVLYIIASVSIPWMTTAVKLFLGVSVFQVAFCLCISAITTREYRAEGYTFSNIFEPSVETESVSVFTSILLMLMNSLFNFCWMWYFNKLQPTYYADKYAHLFCVKKSYWWDLHLDKERGEWYLQENKFMEPDPLDHTPGIQIQNLAKVSRDKVIMAETNLNILDNQVTVILGPDGEDKHALIGMITGLTHPTQGTVIVWQYDVTVSRRQAVENVGLCPKYDILFSQLTCLEYLTFCYQIKGIQVEKTEIIDFLADIELKEKVHTLTVELRTYERKLLSLASITIGDPRVIIVNEPSEDLDIEEQRGLWTFLKTLRQGRSILVVTTNLMEAEALADRLAVMIDGDVKCYGSQMFLKNVYGVGYQLSVTKHPGCQSAAVTDFITKIVTTATLLDESSEELCYHLVEDDISKFSKLLFNLESQVRHLKIGALSLYTVTLNEVLTKVQQGFDPKTRARTMRVSFTSGSKRGSDETAIRGTGLQTNIRKKVRTKAGSIAATDSKDYQNNHTDMNVRTPIPNVRERQDSFTEVTVQSLSSDSDSNRSKEGTFSSSSVRTSGIRETLINLGMTTLQQHQDKREYGAFRKKYSLDLKGISNMKKMQAILIAEASALRRRWVVTVLQTGISPVLLMLGIILDKQSFSSQHNSSVWFSLDNFWSTHVNVFTSNYSDVDLVNCYKKVVPAKHSVKVIELNNSMETAEDYLTELLRNIGWKTYIKEFLVGADFSRSSFRDGIALYNLNFHYGMAISTQMLLNAHVQKILGVQFSVNSGQLGINKDLVERTVYPWTTLGLTLGLVVFSVPCVRTLIFERESGMKSLLEIYGVTHCLYWLSRFVCNMILYSVVVIYNMATFSLNKVVYIDDGRWKMTVLLLYLSAVACLTQLYILQKFFHAQSNGVLGILLLQVVAGVCGSLILICWNVLQVTARTEPQAVIVSVLSLALEVMSPLYSLTAIILTFPVHMGVASSVRGFADDIDYAVLQSAGISLQRCIIILLCQSVIYYILIFVDGFRIIGCLWSHVKNEGEVQYSVTDKELEDDDVTTVKERVKSKLIDRQQSGHKQKNFTTAGSMSNHDALIVQHLQKRYAGTVAVEDISMVVENTDCFALLGPTGSGKSTMLYLLAGIEPITDGNIYIKGYNIQHNLTQVQSLISFAPQNNVLYPLLTGRETLHFFGRLRGVPQKYLYKEAKLLLNLLKLKKLADCTVSTYSSSKKRLLSVAISLLGRPALILLDEPSSGLDSVEKNVLWSLMRRARQFNTAIFFTTRSVEECEAVCTNMAIQIDGQFKCLGSPSHLKKKFAVGYTIHLYLASGQQDLDSYQQGLVAQMFKYFPGTAVSETNEEYISFRVPDSDMKLFKMFKTLQTIKKMFHLKTFVVQETTLEQVYLSFAKGHYVKPAMVFVPGNKTVTWAKNVKETVRKVHKKSHLSPKSRQTTTGRRKSMFF